MPGPNKNFGDINADNVGTETDPNPVNGELYPTPGEVQSAVDEIASAGNGTVNLVSSQTYEPTSAWEVKPGVTLQCHEAEIIPDGDHDVFHQHPKSKIFGGFVNLDGLTFTSAVLVRDTAFNGPYFSDGTTAQNIHVSADQGTGTGIHFVTESGNYIAYTDAHMTVEEGAAGDPSLGQAIHLENNGDFINANEITGFYRDPANGILQDGSNTSTDGNSGNIFKLYLQASPSTSVGWDVQVGGSNIFFGQFNDPQNVSTPRVIGSDSGSGNVMFVPSETDASYIRDNISNNATPAEKCYTYSMSQLMGGFRLVQNQTKPVQPYEYVRANANSSATTVQLPTATFAGQWVHVAVNSDANGVDVETTDGSVIEPEAASSVSISSGTHERFFVNAGGNWIH